MLTFDSFTLIPAYSEIESRSSGVDISSLLVDGNGKVLTNLYIPVINANMHSICTEELVDKLLVEGAAASYHRFFRTQEERNQTLLRVLKNRRNREELSRFYPSIGVQKEDYEFVDWLVDQGTKNVIVDVNHGHHKLVGDILKYIRDTHPKLTIMAGNVSSTDGIKYLRDRGAHIIKIGNSFGSVCSTRFATGVGVHCLHVAKTYRDDTNDWDTLLCLDGSIEHASDIAKCMIWGNMVMVGKMFAACDESYGRTVMVDNQKFKDYWGNASIVAKQVVSKEDNHVRHIEGVSKLIPASGPIQKTLDGIIDGIQSSFSFMGARNLTEFQMTAPKQILEY